MVQMHEDNIFQEKIPFSNLLFANGVVTCVIVMKCPVMNTVKTELGSEMSSASIPVVQISSSLLAKNICSFTRFLQYPQTDLYQFFALSKGYTKEELSLIKE